MTSLSRWRAIFSLASIVLPLSLYSLFERQARRLEALASFGEPVTAHVTEVSRNENDTVYTYRVEGREYAWSVGRAEAPFEVGETFSAMYLPEDPSFTRPTVDRSLVTQELASQRSFSWKMCSGIALILLLIAWVAHRDLKRLRAGTPSELITPAAYMRRLRRTVVFFVVIVFLTSAYHFQDAVKRGGSVVPVLVSGLLTAVIVGGAIYGMARDGPVKARQRVSAILPWMSMIVFGISLIRFIAHLWGE